MTVQEVLKVLIKDTISPLFKEEGFRRKGNNFAKTFEDFSYTVNIQSSKWNTKNEVEFFFNTGIYIEKVFEILHCVQKTEFPLEVNSVLRTRATELSNNNSWYKLTKDTDLNQFRQMIIDDINNYIFPHFWNFGNLEDVIYELEKREKHGIYQSPHNLTILYQATGKIEKAQERINKVFHQFGVESQKQFTKELAGRLGLDI